MGLVIAGITLFMFMEFLQTCKRKGKGPKVSVTNLTDFEMKPIEQ